MSHKTGFEKDTSDEKIILDFIIELKVDFRKENKVEKTYQKIGYLGSVVYTDGTGDIPF